MATDTNTTQESQWSSVPNAGLIDGQQATASTAAASRPVDATAAGFAKRKVGLKQTVAGQLNKIIDADGPLQQQAAARSRAAMADRGLVNSSMAVGAGQAAVIDSAMPIAQQDAATYSAAAAQRVSERNQTNQFNANQANQVALTNQAAEQDINKFNASQQTQTSQFNASARQAADQFNISENAAMLRQGMDADTRVKLADIEANYQTLMQASQSAGTLYSQMLTNLSNITMNKDMSAAAKDAAVRQQYEYLTNGMNLIAAMNNLNVDDLLKFDPPGAPPPPPGAPPPRPPAPPPPPGGGGSGGGGYGGYGSGGSNGNYYGGGNYDMIGA